MATLLKGRENVFNFLLKTQSGKFISRLEAGAMVFDGMDCFLHHVPDEVWKSNFQSKRMFLINHTLPSSVFFSLSKEEQKILVTTDNDTTSARCIFWSWFSTIYKDFVFAQVENFGKYMKEYNGSFYIFDKAVEE
jgi:hypothetical protein